MVKPTTSISTCDGKRTTRYYLLRKYFTENFNRLTLLFVKGNNINRSDGSGNHPCPNSIELLSNLTQSEASLLKLSLQYLLTLLKIWNKIPDRVWSERYEFYILHFWLNKWMGGSGFPYKKCALPSHKVCTIFFLNSHRDTHKNFVGL